jgi:uncharacterized membrane protein
MNDWDLPAGRPPVTGRTRSAVIAMDRAILVLARHWLAFLNLFIFGYVGLPFLAPVFMKAHLEGAARVIYTIYSGLCHQLGYRSWFLFGERVVYTRDIFQQYTGINPDDIWAARAFIGNEKLGFKVAYCERDVAIYGAILIFGLLYSLPAFRQRVRPLNWLMYGLIGVAPIALDGFSQLFSQYPYNMLAISGIRIFGFLPYRESTPLLRTLTGALFGLANAWLAMPYLLASMSEIRRELEVKLARVDAAGR